MTRAQELMTKIRFKKVLQTAGGGATIRVKPKEFYRVHGKFIKRKRA